MNRLATIFSLLIAAIAPAQDLHFSQYYLSPLSLNPANTGRYRGDYSVYANYRSQWRQLGDPFNTYSAGFDVNPYPFNLHASGGLLFISDRSGGDLVVNKIIPSVAFHHRWELLSVHIGVQPGVVFKSLDFFRSSLPEQMNWSTGQFDHTMPTTEENFRQRTTYFDPNAGIVVTRKFSRFEPELGFSVFHLTRPKDGFADRFSRLPMKKLYNLRIGYQISGRIILRAHTLYAVTTGVNNWLSGGNVEYVLSKDAFFTNVIFIGGMFRNGYQRNPDAGIVTGGFSYREYTLGLSYDITRSELQTAVDSRGAFEIAFIYRGKSTRLVKKQVGCARH